MNPQDLREYLVTLQKLKSRDEQWSPYLGPAIQAGNTFADLLQWHRDALAKMQPPPSSHNGTGHRE
jgi:hypothetical protein